MGKVRINRSKGTRDILPPETEIWSAVERIANEVFSSYGYGEIRTPVMEPTDLFVRSVGESTDIVHKEMFTFEDRGGRSVTLRPENTAGVVRAIIEARQTEPVFMPLRLFYVGTQYRYERPQKGRYREFHQIGAELFGAPGPVADAELLEMLFCFLRRLGFQDLSVSLNAVPMGPGRQLFSDALKSHFDSHPSSLSVLGEDDRRRLGTNPLRLFDSKDPNVEGLLSELPKSLDFLESATRTHYERLKSLLHERQLPFVENPRLVRGLDYYTGPVFEITSSDLGAQDAILGGGRYDNLVSELGGPHLAAVGFAIGEDRLLSTLPNPSKLRAERERTFFIVIPSDEASDRSEISSRILRVAEEVRRSFAGTAVVDTDLTFAGYSKGLARVSADMAIQAGSDSDINVDSILREKRRWSRGRYGEYFAILVGEKSEVTVKNLTTRTQKDTKTEHIFDTVSDLVKPSNHA
jgi:histidyl-tRNA synthetase